VPQVDSTAELTLKASLRAKADLAGAQSLELYGVDTKGGLRAAAAAASSGLELRPLAALAARCPASRSSCIRLTAAQR
jgi:hypothetical protein